MEVGENENFQFDKYLECSSKAYERYGCNVRITRFQLLQMARIIGRFGRFRAIGSLSDLTRLQMDELVLKWFTICELDNFSDARAPLHAGSVHLWGSLRVHLPNLDMPTMRDVHPLAAGAAADAAALGQQIGRFARHKIGGAATRPVQRKDATKTGWRWWRVQVRTRTRTVLRDQDGEGAGCRHASPCCFCIGHIRRTAL